MHFTPFFTPCSLFLSPFPLVLSFFPAHHNFFLQVTIHPLPIILFCMKDTPAFFFRFNPLDHFLTDDFFLSQVSCPCLICQWTSRPRNPANVSHTGRFPPRKNIQGGPYITANLYCICLSEHETCA